MAANFGTIFKNGTIFKQNIPKLPNRLHFIFSSICFKS